MKKLIPLFVLLMLQLNVEAQMGASVDRDWVLKASEIDPSNYYGITVGNGMLGIVSSSRPLEVKDVVLNGAYDSYGRGMVSNILKVFNIVNMHMDIDSERINSGNISNLTQELNMKEAILKTRFNFRDKATVEVDYMALRELPYTALVRVTVQARKNILFEPASVLEAPDMLRDVQNYYNEIERPQALIPLLVSTAKSPTGRYTIAACNSFIFPEKNGRQPHVIHEMWDNNMHLIRFAKHLKAGERYQFSVIGSVISSAQNPDPFNEAQRLTIFAALEGSRKLLERHLAAWDSLWRGDIEIIGDNASQLAVRSMLYHLYSFVRSGTAYSISPMGLSGLGYNGHIFWDADLWMYPALLMLHPDLAKSMITYRFDRLTAAERNAAEHGYKGAMFPWESAETGNEETPVWALSGPFEHHITACVGMAAWDYFTVTQDTSWLRKVGYPMLKETADFWISRVDRRGPGHYDIDNVVAADEWAENVNNDAFTNASAIVNLRDAVKASKVLGMKPNPDWTQVADNIPILRFPDGTIREHGAYHGEAVKQADVNLLSYPLGIVKDKQTIKKDLAYYEPRIGNGPAMSYAVFSLLYARLGNMEKAYTLFKKAFVPNETPPFGVLAETAGGTNPYFATGAGGVLQAVLSGFGGLNMTDHGIVQTANGLPASWKELRITTTGPRANTYILKP